MTDPGQTATIHVLPICQDRVRVVWLEHLDGRPLAAATFARGQTTAAWQWIEDRIAELVNCATSDVGVADDDVITVEGFPVARVIL